MTYGSAPMCLYCKHFRPKTAKYTCDAYPEGIPSAIIEGQVDHRNPFHDDEGVRFEPKTPALAEAFEEIVAPLFK